jgi:cellulose synthase/poly-beta-1,6-N-acetylglucosamine synthase-like glycosyltransferase
MDADCIATPSWLEELMKGFQNEKVGSTGGPHLAPPTSTAFQLRVEQFFHTTAPLISFFKTKRGQEISETDHNPLCNVAYRADLFRKIGGFREDIWPGEDVAIDFVVKDLGYKITYNPKALVFHHRPENIEQFRKVMHAYGRAQGKLIREFGVRRKIQWIFLGLINLFLIPMALMLLAAQWNALFIELLIWATLWNWRPKTDTDFSIALNACQWANGFVEGFSKNRSDPPGSRPVSQNNN